MVLKHFSSRTERLDTDFLAKTLKGASKYFRIAGYFRSSIFELVGEEIAQIPEVKIICNSELDLADFQVATGRNTALKERWNEVDVEAEALLKKERYQILDNYCNPAMWKSGLSLKSACFCMAKPDLYIIRMAVVSRCWLCKRI